MKYRNLLVILVVIILALAACAPVSTESPATVMPTEPIATEPSLATESPAVTEPPATGTQTVETPSIDATTTVETPATEATSAGSPTAVVPVTGSATVNVEANASYGPILVNSEGLSLYIFMSDALKDGTSACMGNCEVVWPPLISEGEPTANNSADPSLLGTITRGDGSTQVTYNGWPLYLYHADARSGDTNGQGVNDSGGSWYLLSPDGEPIEF